MKKLCLTVLNIKSVGSTILPKPVTIYFWLFCLSLYCPYF